jgi:predicted N-acetyltransferase YhbS
LIIRAEIAADHAAIKRIVGEAFGGTIEGEIVDAIRASDRFVPELSLVAVSDREPVGHVISSYADVVPDTRRVLLVGPLAVLPPYQRRGIGSALMQETIRLADERGEPLLLIEGNPKYYGRFGFTRADDAGIEPPPEAHGPQYFMMRSLAAYDASIRGRAIYPPETFGIAY